MNASRDNPTARPISQYLIELATRVHAKRVLARFLADTRDVEGVQRRVLRSLIGRNADSDYGREHGFRSIRTYEDFVRQVPITSYSDLAPWIDRVKSGDVRAMFGGRQRVRMFAMTSGTVDTPKYIPVTDRFLADQRAGWNAFGVKALMDHAGTQFMRPIVQVISPMDESHAPSGVPCGAITGLMATMQRKIIKKYYVVPPEVAYIADPVARRYAIMRLAIPTSVGWIVTASPATVLQLARTGEEHAESIIRDVRDGTLSATFEVSADIRAAIAPRLSPDADCAKRLDGILSRSGALRPRDYWNLAFLANWTGGTMGLYLRDYPEYFGDTPVRDIGLIASEGRMSIPIADGTPAGVAAISTVFLEFIPASDYGQENPQTLRAHQLERGREYFLLLTTSAGFYRYDIGDCVRVVGFENDAPLIEFLHKGAHVSSIAGEKITERQVVLAFERAATARDIRTARFVLAPQWSDPAFYRLYLETPATDSAALARDVDEQLQDINLEYRSKRGSSRLGCVQACVVRSGALDAPRQSNGGRARRGYEQFKHRYLYSAPGDDASLAAACENGPVIPPAPIRAPSASAGSSR